MMDEAERLMFLGWSKMPQFQRKVEQAKSTIREALAIAPAYVACSWGKDSTVLLHLCQQVQSDIPAYFLGHSEQDLISNFSEIAFRYCEKFNPNYQEIRLAPEDEKQYRPDKIKWALSNIEGIPPLALIGVRAEESINRRRSVHRHGLIYQYKSGNYRCFPLAFWSTNDIWAYIVNHNIPYLRAYDQTDKQSKESRTSLHFGRSANSALSAQRWEQFRRIAPEFVQHVKENYNANWL